MAPRDLDFHCERDLIQFMTPVCAFARGCLVRAGGGPVLTPGPGRAFLS